MSAAERKAYQRDVAKARRAAKRAAEKALRNTMFWSEAAALLEEIREGTACGQPSNI